jgi:TRAP-type C4-dicarboxylate transport system permease large subunit
MDMTETMWDNTMALMIPVVFVGSIVFGIYTASEMANTTHCADPILVNSVLKGLEHRVKEAENNNDHMMNLKIKFSLH